MRAGGSNAKGAAFERQTCKALSLWISNGQRDDYFWRTAMSGGRATLGFRQDTKREAQVGDVGLIHEAGRQLTDHFMIECKFYKDLGTRNLIYNLNCKIREFWEVACDEAHEHNRLPFLVFKENTRPVSLMLPHDVINRTYILPNTTLYYVKRMPLDADVFDFEALLNKIQVNTLINGHTRYQRLASNR